MQKYTIALGTALSSIMVVPTSAFAQEAEPILLDRLEETFRDIARSCLSDRFNPDDLKKRRILGEKVRTAIPDAVLDFDPIESRLGSRVGFNQFDGIDREFARVYQVQGEQRSAIGAGLDLFWGDNRRPLFADFSDATLIAHNCITYAMGTTGFQADAVILSAAASASIEGESQVGTFIHAGRILNPYAWATGQSGSVSDSVRPNYPRVAYLSRIWEWYQTNPSHMNSSLEIDGEITALTIMSASISSQATILTAQANAGFGIGPVTIGGSAGLDASNLVDLESVDFESAVLNRDRRAVLPRASIIADALERELDLVGIEEGNPSLVGSEDFEYKANISSLTQDLCIGGNWTGTASGSFTQVDFDWQYLNNGICQFTWSLRPPQESDNAHRFELTATSTIGTANTRESFSLSSGELTLGDSRSLLSLDRPRIGRLDLPAEEDGEAGTHSATFNILETNGAELGTVFYNTSSVSLTCEAMGTRKLYLTNAVPSGATPNRRLVLEFEYDGGEFVGLQAGQTDRCSLSGNITVRRENVEEDTVEIALPTRQFVIARQAVQPAPAAAAANADEEAG